MTSNVELDKFRFAFRKKQDGVKLSVYDGKKLIGVVGAVTAGNCYLDSDTALVKYRRPANVVSAEILPEYRGRKLYQEMLLRLRKYAKEELGCAGLKSEGFQRSSMATRAWKKLNPRVEVKGDEKFGREDLFLDGLPPRLELRERFPTLSLRSGFTADREPRVWVREESSGEEVGYVFAASCAKGEYAAVRDGEIDPRWQRKGLYPVMLTELRNVAQSNGCRGVVSRGSGRIKEKSTRSWERFSRNEPRVRREGSDYYLDGLPTRGRIPLDTAKRALKRLPTKTRACGITPEELREGMEIEREHRDVTGGRVGTTAKIAAAHLCEDRRYYKKLKKYVER